MPKRTDRDNRRGGKPNSFKDLLARSGLGQAVSAERVGASDELGVWLATHLSDDLMAQIADFSEREGRLVVFARTAAWSARLRYALAERWSGLQAERPQLREFVVKVQPAAAKAGART